MFNNNLKQIQQDQRELLELTRRLHSQLETKLELLEATLAKMQLDQDKQGHLNLKLDFIFQRLDDLEKQKENK